MSVVEQGIKVALMQQGIKVDMSFMPYVVAQRYGITISNKIVPYHKKVDSSFEKEYIYFGRVDLMPKITISYKTDTMPDYIESVGWWFIDCFKSIDIEFPDENKCILFKGWRVAI